MDIKCNVKKSLPCTVGQNGEQLIIAHKLKSEGKYENIS